MASSSPAPLKTDTWLKREHTYSTVEGEEQLYTEVTDQGGLLQPYREPIDPPPPAEFFHTLLNSKTVPLQSERMNKEYNSDNSLNYGQESMLTISTNFTTENIVKESNNEPPYTTIFDPGTSSIGGPSSSLEVEFTEYSSTKMPSLAEKTSPCQNYKTRQEVLSIVSEFVPPISSESPYSSIGDCTSGVLEEPEDSTIVVVKNSSCLNHVTTINISGANHTFNGNLS